MNEPRDPVGIYLAALVPMILAVGILLALGTEWVVVLLMLTLSVVIGLGVCLGMDLIRAAERRGAERFDPWPWQWRRMKQYKRVQSGLCFECGYDLRASEWRCPECGNPIESAESLLRRWRWRDGGGGRDGE